MATLQRLASVYPHYKTALGAGSGTDLRDGGFAELVDRSERGEKVLAIYDECAGDWDATNS